MLTSNHSIIIYVSRRYQWTPQLPHLAKYLESYTCSNLSSLGSHSLAIAAAGRPTQIAISPSSHLKSLSILEFTCHKLLIADGLTLVPPSLRGWEVFPTPGTLTHTRITWALSPMVPQVLGVTPGSPLCPWCFGHSSWRGAR